MRILHVQETLSPRYGGPATVLPQLARAQAQSGLEVEILTTNADYPSGRYCEPGRTALPGSEAMAVYCSVQFNAMKVSIGLAAYLHRHARQFDLIHVHGLYRFPPSYAARYARRAGIPYIIRPHGSLDPYLYNRSTRSVALKRAYERWVDFPNLNAANAIHYTAEEERSRVAFLGLKAPSFIVPNGLDWSNYERLPPRGALRARLGLGDDPVVLFLGRLNFKKGLDILIEAFDLVARTNGKARLLIVGPENDDYGDKVRAWISDRGLVDKVHLTGPLFGEEALQAYVDSDVFVLPSYAENFGMTVVEAMACGTPVVISDQVNIHSEVARSGAGIVTRCDAGEVAAALSALLDNPERLRTAGKTGREFVLRHYTWPATVALLTTQYERIVSEAAAP